MSQRFTAEFLTGMSMLHRTDAADLAAAVLRDLDTTQIVESVRASYRGRGSRRQTSVVVRFNGGRDVR